MKFKFKYLLSILNVLKPFFKRNLSLIFDRFFFSKPHFPVLSISKQTLKSIRKKSITYLSIGNWKIYLTFN